MSDVNIEDKPTNNVIAFNKNLINVLIRYWDFSESSIREFNVRQKNDKNFLRRDGELIEINKDDCFVRDLKTKKVFLISRTSLHDITEGRYKIGKPTLIDKTVLR